VEDIISMVNARNTRGGADELIVEDLMETWPETDQDIADLKERMLSNEMYRNTLISENGKYTTIVIRTDTYADVEEKQSDLLEGFEDKDGQEPESEGSVPDKHIYLTDKENSETVEAVGRIIEKYKGDDFSVYIAGSPVVTHFLKRTMMKDMRIFMVLVITVVAVFLYLMFRKISAVILSMLVVFLSILSTVGAMAAAGVPIKLPTQILPSFLLAVGVGASIHILAMFYHRFRQSGNKEDAVVYALGHSGLPVVMTSLTTAGGLLSFSTADLAPIANLGVFAGVGIMLGLAYTIILLPALLMMAPIKDPKYKDKKEKHSAMDRLLNWVSDFTTGNPYTILMVSAVVVGFSIAGATKIRFSHDPVKWFPDESPIRLATKKIDHELLGSTSLEIIIDTGKENGLYDAQILNRIEKAAAYMESLEGMGVKPGKAWSLTTILKEINQALNENRPDFYTVPQDRELIAQEFLLFENSGSDDLEDIVDSQFSKARFTIRVPFEDAVAFSRFIDAVDRYFEENFPGANIVVTGMVTLLFKTITNVMTSMKNSYIIAFVVITVLMILLIGRVRIGMLSMIPNLCPILLTVGIMGAFSIPMDLFTMMVGSIAIGLAVDDTIHFMHNFRRYYESSGNPEAAVRESFYTTGRAMLVTSIVLSAGFCIYTFASMKNLFNFGLLTSFTIATALISNYLITPALMVVLNPKRGASSEKRAI